MTHARPGSHGARSARCPRCGDPVLRQLVGRRAALDVTADHELLAAPVALAQAGPNRLAWCVHELSGAGPDLRWIASTHPADCSQSHVLDHACTGPPPTAPAGPEQQQLIFDQ